MKTRKIDLAKKAATIHGNFWKNSGRNVTSKDYDFLTALHMKSTVSVIMDYISRNGK